jgi:ribosomal-protein-serine acetyltransferase
MNITISEEIILRPVELDDARPLFDLIHTYRDSLRIWLPFIDYTKTWEDTRDFISSVIFKHPDEKDDVFVVLIKESIAGLIGFRSTDRFNRRTEIGYWIAPPFEGKGTATLCCSALLDYCFKVKDFNRIAIRVAVGNLRSSNIPKRLGFTLEGIERQGELLNKRFTDLEVYSILKREWVKKS